MTLGNGSETHFQVSQCIPMESNLTLLMTLTLDARCVYSLRMHRSLGISIVRVVCRKAQNVENTAGNPDLSRYKNRRSWMVMRHDYHNITYYFFYSLPRLPVESNLLLIDGNLNRRNSMQTQLFVEQFLV